MTKYIWLPILIIIGFSFSKIENKKSPADESTKINWMTFEQAIAAQKKNPKKIMMDAYTDWCGPCKMLDAQTFQNPDVVKYVNANFYAVKFDAEGNETISFKGKTYTNPNYDPAKDKARNSSHQLSGYYGINAYPTIVFIDENANTLSPVKGFLNAQQIELYLKLFATDDYKNIKTNEDWAAYQKSFKSTFK